MRELTSNDQLIIGICQAVFQAGYVERDPAKYLEKYDFQIEGVGRLFRYLGLATRDQHSALGWEADKRLLQLIAKRRTRPSERRRKIVESDQLVLHLLIDVVFHNLKKSSRDAVILFCFDVLGAVGLAEESEEGNWKAKPLLVELFWGAYNEASLKHWPPQDGVWEVLLQKSEAPLRR